MHFTQQDWIADNLCARFQRSHLVRLILGLWQFLILPFQALLLTVVGFIDYLSHFTGAISIGDERLTPLLYLLHNFAADYLR